MSVSIGLSSWVAQFLKEELSDLLSWCWWSGSQPEEEGKRSLHSEFSTCGHLISLFWVQFWHRKVPTPTNSSEVPHPEAPCPILSETNPARVDKGQVMGDRTTWLSCLQFMEFRFFSYISIALVCLSPLTAEKLHTNAEMWLMCLKSGILQMPSAETPLQTLGRNVCEHLLQSGWKG